MKNYFLEKLLTPILVGIFVGGTITFINWQKTNNDNEKRYIDCLEENNFNKLDSTELRANKIQVLFNGKPVPAVSTMNVNLYNFSDKDYQNLKISIEIKCPGCDSVQLLNSEILGAHQNSNGVKQVSNKRNSEGTLLLEYLVDIANRADFFNDKIFDAHYELITNEKPELTVTVSGMGVEKRMYEAEHFYRHSWFDSESAAVLFVFLCYCILIFIIALISRYFSKRRNKRLREYMLKRLSKRINDGQLMYDAENILKEYDDAYRWFEYEDASYFMKQIKRLKPPDDVTGMS